VIFHRILVILLIHVKIMEVVQIQMQIFMVMNVIALLALMVFDVKMIADLVNQILVGIMEHVMKHQIQHSNVHVIKVGQVNIVKK